MKILKSLSINFKILFKLFFSSMSKIIILSYIYTKIKIFFYRKFYFDDRLFNENSSFKKYKITKSWYKNNIIYWLFLIRKYKLFNKKMMILEIGSYEGASAVFFLKKLKNITKIYCVDTWSNKYHYGLTTKNIQYSKIEERFDFNTSFFYNKIKKFKKTSDIFFKNLSFSEKFDLIYVDGSHKFENVLRDSMNALKNCKKNGFIIFDDFLRPEPLKAISFFLNKNFQNIKIILVYNQIIIRKVK
jgi:predicted O-methyltransferase YrrM